MTQLRVTRRYVQGVIEAAQAEGSVDAVEQALGAIDAALKENREPIATDAEAACYLFTASLTAPIGSDWTQIYLYVAGGEMKDEAKTEMPADIKVEALTEYQWRELKGLKNWIYQQRVKHRKEKARGERRQEQEKPEIKEATEAEELETKPVQHSFF